MLLTDRTVQEVGETDLAGFRDFFAENGECVVLALQPLSEAERIDVLTAQGVNDPAAFLAEAQNKQLDDLLGNPQNLKMLSADPFGVLSYGDAKALAPSLRNFLLSKLAKLAEVDPWFRSGNWSAATVAGLSGPDMLVGFREILTAEDANFSLRTLVLDALTAGHPIPELLDELQVLAGNSLVSYAERSASVEALYRLAEPGTNALAVTYGAIGTGADELRLKAKILKKLLGTKLGIDAFAMLFCDVLLCKSKVPFDVLYHLADKVADSDVCAALNLISENTKTTSSDGVCADVWGLDREFDSLLHRALAIDSQIDGERLLTWLECRHKVSNRDYAVNADSMQKLVADYPAAIERAINAALRGFRPDESIWLFFHHLRELGITNYGDSLFLNCCVRLFVAEANASKKGSFFELALIAAMQCGTDALPQFDLLLESADGHPALEEIPEVL